MNDAFDGILRFIGQLLPLILLLSMFGLGRGKKKAPPEKRSAAPARPSQAPRPRSRPEPAPTAESPFPTFDPFEDPGPVAAAPRQPAPPPPPPPPPRPQAPAAPRASLKPRIESTKAYTIDAGLAYDIVEKTGHAYDFSGDDQPLQAYDTDREAYRIEGEETLARLSARQLVPRGHLRRDDLRRAILMREILDQPVALRDETRRYW